MREAIQDPSALGASPTMFIQVPDSKSLIPGCRDQNQTSTGCETQISHDILVARKIQKQEPWREQKPLVSVRRSRLGSQCPLLSLVVDGVYGPDHMS